MDTCWESYYSGEHISDTDLLEMIQETSDALNYLEKRGERFYLAASMVRRDLSQLESWKQSRGLEP
jgi:hypothetical protein